MANPMLRPTVRPVGEESVTPWPQSVLLVGCGLIGVSMVKALTAVLPDVLVDGVEPHEEHRGTAAKTGCFRRIEMDLSQVNRVGQTYDLVVLAVPVDVACDLLPQAGTLGEVVMDVCSVKTDICARAEELGLRRRFFPSHPMAGIASEGPSEATADLFKGRPWLGIAHWTVPFPVVELIAQLGSVWIALETAALHDGLMAVVSHSTHVVSLATMLAFREAVNHWEPPLSSTSAAMVCGPAFADVTRLAKSPPGFWTRTLLANRQTTVEHLRRTVGELQDFIDILETRDAVRLRRKLDSARNAHGRWEQDRL